MKIYYQHLLLTALFLLSCEGPMFDVPADVDSTPPTLSITFPADQSVLSDTVYISAYAFDNVEIETVTLYLNDSLILASKDGPYSYTWITSNFAEDEFHTIRAKAEDVSGNINYTNTIQVKVDNQDNINPTGALLFPFTGQTLMGEITIILEAADNEGIAFVNIYIDGDTVNTLTEPPYTYTWNTINEVDDIIYNIYAHVQDISGNQITLGPINVLIDNYEASDNISPTGTITNPPSASTVSGIVNIEVNAYDNVKMGNVDFIIDGSAVFQDSLPPYLYSWNTLEAMEDTDHIINVNLSDSAGNETSLFPITVFVNNTEDADLIPPSVVIFEPASNETVSGIVNFSVIASDDAGVNRVEFYHNYELEGIVTSGSDGIYNYEWNTIGLEDDTEHIWFAKVYDTSENEAQTQPMTLHVDNEDGVLPSGFFLYPYAGQTLSGIVNIQISASDNAGIIQVVFFINGDSVHTSYGSDYIYEWNTDTASEDEIHVLSATITDIGYNSVDIAPIAVTVNNDLTPGDDTTPPVVAILTPLSSQTVSDSVFISGFATDNVSVEQVQFLINEQLISTLIDTPYSFLWGTYELPNNSQHIIQMIAQDPTGNQSSAQPVLVTVQNEYNGEISNLALTASEENVLLSWNAPFDAASYMIYRDSGFLAEITQQTYEDNISGGVEYCYTVSAVNNVGIEGAQSSESCGVPLLPAPTSFSATINDTIITLVWNVVDQASGYSLKRDNATIWEGTDLEYVDSGLDFNTTYLYTVSAYDFQDSSGTSSEALTVNTPEELTPPTLSMTVSDSTATLNWSSVGLAESYRVYQDSDFLIEVTDLEHSVNIGTESSVCFVVTSIDEEGGESSDSNEECGSGS